MRNFKESQNNEAPSHSWQGWLLMVLMSVTGLGWGLLAATDLSGGQFTSWLPDWPRWTYLLVALLLFSGAFGFYRFQAWGWLIALLFILVGVVSLLSQLLAMFTQCNGFLFLLPVVGVISLPYLLHRRSEFSV